MVRVVLRHPLPSLSLHRLTPAEIATYRDERLAVVTASTVRRELAIVRHCLQVARNEWGFVLPSNPVDNIKLPAPNNPRERRATEGELQELLSACEARGNRWLAAAIQLAVETGMRRSELLGIKWADVDLVVRTISLRSTKNGHPPLCRSPRVPLKSSTPCRVSGTRCSHDSECTEAGLGALEAACGRVGVALL
jgi:integrase